VAEREWAATGSPRNTGADPRPECPVTIDEGVTTPGAVGNTLVKGVIMQLPAEAFSVKPGGVVERLIVGGNLETHGDKVTTCAVEGGKVSAIGIGGEITANGQGSGAVRVSSGGSTPLTNVRVRAKTGDSLDATDGEVTDKTGFAISSWAPRELRGLAHAANEGPMSR
jgi:hypothetical protein